MVQALPRLRWDLLIEVGLIVAWAMWVGRAYLDLDPAVWPNGREFGMVVQPQYVWTLLSECGACVLWNGFVNGGAPASVELHGVVLHPLVIVTTLLWGGTNGTKMALIGSLAMAGLAQWWLARVMRLGLVPRLWSAGLVVVGGHLAGRMELGVFGVVLSTAACSLIIAPGLELALTGKRRAAVWLGITLALALVSGQGYMQLGVVLGLLPAFGLFLLGNGLRICPVWKEFVLAGVLALLLAGVFWVPLLHFWPNFSKDISLSWNGTQPLGYVPLNFVIHDMPYYVSEVLNKLPYPYLYANYIGWVPVLLATLTLRLVSRAKLQILVFFLVAISLVLLASSATTFRLLATPFPEIIAGVRYPSLIAGLAVPLVIGLAAWGLDRLLGLDWSRLISTASGRSIPGSSSAIQAAGWLVITLFLVWSVKSPYDFSKTWLGTNRMSGEIYQVVQTMQVGRAQWVAFPFGEHFWTPPAISAGLKTTSTVRPWRWKDRELPPAYVEGTREPIDTFASNFLGSVGDVNVVVHPKNEYAFVDTGSQRIPCRAAARGGNIDVDCDADAPGTLIVRENQWAGWQARRNRASVALGEGPWLSVPAPSGQHHYEFRYRPWDVVVGLLLTLLGIALAVWLWFRCPVTSEEKGDVQELSPHETNQETI